MERRQLLALSGWSEEYLHDFNKKIKSGKIKILIV